MKTVQEHVLKGKKIFIGLENSKKTWKICVRCDQMIVHEVSMPAKYEVLKTYLSRHFPECKIRLMYEPKPGWRKVSEAPTQEGVEDRRSETTRIQWIWASRPAHPRWSRVYCDTSAYRNSGKEQQGEDGQN